MKYDCFLAHAKEDRQFTEQLYLELKRAGFSPWMDKPPVPFDMDGIPYGDGWDFAIRDAIKQSAYFFAILSDLSVKKQGYVQREYRIALNAMAELPPGEVYLVPILIDDCDLPKVRTEGINFSDYQAMELHDRDTAKILKFLRSKRKEIQIPQDKSFPADARQFADVIRPKSDVFICSDMPLEGFEHRIMRHVEFSENFDGVGLRIRDCDGLSIIGDESIRSHIYISPQYPNVLTFKNCRDLRLSNLIIGHSPQRGSCTGGVLHFINCKNVIVDNCDLYGCGTFGIKSEGCDNIYVSRTTIRECSDHIIEIYQSSDLVFQDCIFTDNEKYSGVLAEEADLIKFINVEFIRNKFSGSLFAVGSVGSVSLSQCKIANNVGASLSNRIEALKIVECVLIDNHWSA